VNKESVADWVAKLSFLTSRYEPNDAANGTGLFFS
jgi:hypothetical protein